jgi:hypothetical protein
MFAITPSAGHGFGLRSARFYGTRPTTMRCSADSYLSRGCLACLPHHWPCRWLSPCSRYRNRHSGRILGLLRQPLRNRHAEQRPAGIPVGRPVRGVRKRRVEHLVGEHDAEAAAMLVATARAVATFLPPASIMIFPTTIPFSWAGLPAVAAITTTPFVPRHVARGRPERDTHASEQ